MRLNALRITLMLEAQKRHMAPLYEVKVLNLVQQNKTSLCQSWTAVI